MLNLLIFGLLVALGPPMGAQDAGSAVTEKGLRETFREDYASTDEAVRAEAITALSDSSRALPDGGSSKMLARTFASAMKSDKSPAVQAAAAGALAWGRHVETSIDAMSDMLHEMSKLSAKLSTRPDEASRTQRRQATQLYTQLCQALSRHPDDRTLKALKDELKKQRPRSGSGSASVEFVRPLSTALLQLGSQEAVECVVSTTAVFSGSALVNNGGTARGLHEALAAYSEEVGYGSEAFSDRYDQLWRKWLKEHKRELPPKLGKLKDPVEAPEYRPNNRSRDRQRPGERERP
jgi:hypothetical protein